MPADKLPLPNPIADDGLFMMCRECVFYRGTLIEGLCRGRPPAVIMTGVLQDMGGNSTPQLGSFWPRIPGDEFCGAFKPDRDKVYEDMAGVPSAPPAAPVLTVVAETVDKTPPETA